LEVVPAYVPSRVALTRRGTARARSAMLGAPGRVEARTTDATVAAILMRDAVFMPGPTSGLPRRFPDGDGVAKR
jgi:hypothetical protein